MVVRDRGLPQNPHLDLQGTLEDKGSRSAYQLPPTTEIASGISAFVAENGPLKHDGKLACSDV